VVLPKNPVKSNETATSLVPALFKSTRRSPWDWCYNIKS
jgi:hypothetical protein